MTIPNSPSSTGPPEQQDPNKAWLQSPPSTSSKSSPSSSAVASASGSTQDPTNPDPKDQQQNKYHTLSEVAQTIKPADFLTVHQAPCARQGFLTGIGGGFAVLGLRFLTGSPVLKAANWGVGTFVGASVLGWEYCRFQRRKEFEKMKRVVEVYDQRQAEVAREKKLKEEEAARRKKLAEEEERRQRSWWKVW